MMLQYYAFYLYYVRKALLKLCEDASPPLLRNRRLHTFLTTLSQPPNIVPVLLHP